MGTSQFDVFLSFRGEDTRKGFTDHLYERLQEHGVSTFIDSVHLEKGEEIERLLVYIKRSKICIPIFSKGYADSKWCLKEISEIVECNKKVIPVFFNVDPSDVQHQRGRFASAIEKHESEGKVKKEEVSKWREALRKMGNICGFSLKDTDGYEAKLIKLIVKRILDEVNPCHLDVGLYIVGHEFYLEKLMSILSIESNDVRMIGIHGMGGIGKTTLAKAAYNKISSEYEACSFISNVREASLQFKGIESLQQQLLGDVIGKFGEQSIPDKSKGIQLIKEKIGTKKVLIVLDDVDSRDQLLELVGRRDWFRGGSRIIITTRDIRPLIQHGVERDEIYELTRLNHGDSMKLFCYHAFRSEKPPREELVELCDEAVSSIKGLPLALEVFGSQFFDLETLEQRRDLIAQLKESQHQVIFKRLKLSYDSLDENEKQVFLDIACFFLGIRRPGWSSHWEVDHVKHLWEKRSFCPELAIVALKHKGLIKVNESEIGNWAKVRRFEMHDHLRDMGRKIVEDETKDRLLDYPNVKRALQRPGVSKSTKGILLYVEEGKPPFSAPCLREWDDLRLFHIYGAKFEGSLHFPEDLKWLGLPNCQLQLPASVSIPEGIVVLDLCNNTKMANVLLDKCGSKSMVFDQLKILDLSSTGITITPDFSSVPCLVELILQWCQKLVEVHESVGQLKGLVRLDLENCRKLEKLPDSICNLTSLEFLSLSCCIDLPDLPKELGNLASLRHLDIEVLVSIRSLPNSMRKLQSLEHLIIREIEHIVSLDGRDLVSASRLTALSHDFIDGLPDPCCRTKTKLKLIDNGVEELTNSFTRFGNLESLILNCNSLKALPAEVGRLQLKVFEVYSNNLMLLDDALPLENTEKLVVKCASLEHVSSFRRKTENLKHLNLDCKNMKVVPDWIESSSKLETLELKGYKNMELKFPPDHLQLLSIGFTGSLQQIGCLSDLRIPYVFKKLKTLRLVGSPMTVTPNFSYFPCLEELMLTNCKQLIKVDESIGILKKLKFLKITICTMLDRLPESVCELASLEILDLKGCTSLSNLPEQLGDKMELLEQLCLDETGIRSLLAFVGKLTRLQSLSIMKCQSLKTLPETLTYLDSLRDLHVIDDRTSRFIMSSRKESLEVSASWELMDALPRSCCESVHDLDFTNEAIEKLTDSIGRFTNLKFMALTCKMLKAIPDFIGQLKYLRDLTIQCHTLTLFDKICMLESIESLTVECITLEPLPFSSTTLLGTSTASGCENIKEAEPPLIRQSGCFKSVMSKFRSLSLCAKQITVTPDFSVAPSLKFLTLTDCEMLTEVHHSIGTLENLKQLYIRGCNALEGLPNTICHLTSLERLQLAQEFNPSSSPEPSSDLDNHGLPETGIFKSILTYTGQLTKLWHLDLRKSCPSWADVKGVTIVYSSLEISGSCLELLTSLSPFHLQSVTRLDIKDDQIEEFPDCPIRQMENLKKLRLKCKSLKALPKWIGKLENLLLLNLECSTLETLPDCFASLRRLQTLQICGCKNIKGLPDSMRRLERLRSLDLSRTGILELPPWLGCLTHLTSLKLSDPENNLLLSVLSQLPSLEKLDFSESNFGSLPSCISNFSRLKVLDVSGCEQLLSIPHLSSPVLKKLNVSGCKELHSILPLCSLVLKEIDASNCSNLRGLPDFSNLRYLHRLFLGGCNSLESISGLKTFSENIEELSLPGPSGVIQCSNLSDDFKNKAFVGASFRYLREFTMTGNVIGRSHTGQQHLSFLFPDIRRNRYARTWLDLTLGGISSPVHVAVMQGDRVLFETTLAEDEFYENGQGSRTFSFSGRDEIFEYLQEGAATILVSTDVSNLSTAELWARI